MNTIELVVESSSPSSNGGAIIKLLSKEDKTVETAFGTKTAGVQKTFYMKVDKAAIVGTKGTLDLDQFYVVERPYTFLQDKPDKPHYNEQLTVQLKWLHIK